MASVLQSLFCVLCTLYTQQSTNTTKKRPVLRRAPYPSKPNFAPPCIKNEQRWEAKRSYSRAPNGILGPSQGALCLLSSADSFVNQVVPYISQTTEAFHSFSPPNFRNTSVQNPKQKFRLCLFGRLFQHVNLSRLDMVLDVPWSNKIHCNLESIREYGLRRLFLAFLITKIESLQTIIGVLCRLRASRSTLDPLCERVPYDHGVPACTASSTLFMTL